MKTGYNWGDIVNNGTVVVSDWRNSFLTSSDYTRTGDMFDEIVISCGFPETVPITYIRFLNAWLEGFSYDAIFVDFVAWHTPALVGVTKCLISAYAGGSI